MRPERLIINSYLIYQEAIRKGYEIDIIDKATLILQKNGKIAYLKSAKTSSQSTTGYLIALNKDLTKKFLNYFHLPTSKHVVVDDFKSVDSISQLKFPVVIKPTDGFRGDDVYVDIQDIQQAKEIVAKLIDRRGQVLVEEMLLGREYRVTCLDYKPVAVTLRKPAFVTGNGHSTIGELIEEKNQDPMRGESLSYNTPYVKIKIDHFLQECLGEQDLTLESVLPDGQEAYLRKNSNVSTGGEPHNVTEMVCPENIELFERITRVCDLNTSGIDIICSDITKPITEQVGAGVVEINASPAISTPMFPMSGKPVDVASLVVDMVDKELGF